MSCPAIRSGWPAGLETQTPSVGSKERHSPATTSLRTFPASYRIIKTVPVPLV
jgi:hypothetical protein